MKKNPYILSSLIILVLYLPVYAVEQTDENERQITQNDHQHPHGIWWCTKGKIKKMIPIRFGSEHPTESGEQRFGPGGIKVTCSDGEIRILYCPDGYGYYGVRKQSARSFKLLCFSCSN